MEFTYEGYKKLLRNLGKYGYQFCSYNDSCEEADRTVILRHDIDNDISKAVRFAEIESELGVKSTYFVLVTSNFYNIFSKESRRQLELIMEYGHEVGLHFDEMSYPELGGVKAQMIEKILKESVILQDVVEKPIRAVSMHRPSKGVLEADLQIPGMVNSYNKRFLREYKYLSDSRRRWREPVDEIIESGKYNKLHILTHAFWYNEKEIGLYDSLKAFLLKGNTDRYGLLEGNFTDLSKVLTREEII